MRRLVRVEQLVRIQQLVPGGQGMGRLADGRPAFVTGAFPGDEIIVATVEDRRTFVQVRDYSVRTESTERVTPECVDAARCGGCDWMWVGQAEQLRAKADLIEQALSRIGKLPVNRPVQVHRSPRATRYRSRVRLQVDGGRVGFFARGSHELIEVSDCVVSTEELWNLVIGIRKAVSANPAAFAQVAYVEARVFEPQRQAGDSAALLGERAVKGRASVYFSMKEPERGGSRISRDLRAATRVLNEIALVRFSSEACSVQSFSPSPGVTTGAPVGGFTQVNEGINRMLVFRVLAEVKQAGARRFLDLYCGSGNFSLPLLQAGLSGVGVESSAESISAARTQADNNGLSAKFFAESCANHLARERYGPGAFDVVIADPPRAGAKDCVAHLLRLSAPLLLMIACDPASLARDVGELTRGGYRLRSVEGFDMFPQTHHVETLAILEAKQSARLSRPAS